MELLEVVSVPKRRAPFIKSYSKTLPIYLVLKKDWKCLSGLRPRFKMKSHFFTTKLSTYWLQCSASSSNSATLLSDFKLKANVPIESLAGPRSKQSRKYLIFGSNFQNLRATMYVARSITVASASAKSLLWVGRLGVLPNGGGGRSTRKYYLILFPDDKSFLRVAA